MNNKKVKRLPFPIGELVKGERGTRYIALEPNAPWIADNQEEFWHTQKVYSLSERKCYYVPIEGLTSMGNSGGKWEVVGDGPNQREGLSL